ncbi:hypothetical protein D9611_013490 [Ephemerocybe angulata]|uniref:Uncharacterized protein n=1 Tax=Ephemerocybe angulata TaxID=980116 RepID=A0A8H5F9Q8_9AGAR|nr:hypothetical protein D9611_013498 [Tulosesus angulatus]KAF5328946.1 hypothetical protein D9611_013490 [Tulosesus angulatus]
MVAPEPAPVTAFNGTNCYIPRHLCGVKFDYRDQAAPYSSGSAPASYTSATLCLLLNEKPPRQLPFFPV